MSLRIITVGNNALSNAPNQQSLQSSVLRVSSIQNRVPVFEDLNKGAPKLADSIEMVKASLEELNKMLSILHRLSAQFSRLSENSSITEVEAVASVVRSIVRTAPGRKVMELFDPRRSEERFRTLLNNPALSAKAEDFVKSAAEMPALLQEAEEQILSAISSKERLIHLAAVEEENTLAHAGIFSKAELLSLYKLFSS